MMEITDIQQTPAIMTVENLKKYFPVRGGKVHAVDGISFSVNEGETLGIVGESGCGKSTTGRILVRLEDATEGKVIFRGHDISLLGKKSLHEMRQHIQLIFQDPFSSLDPRKRIGEAISKPLSIYRKGTPSERSMRVEELMAQVGLAPNLYNKYPHELDGGRCQRVGIARALALGPSFIVCDEPISALDVSIQAQILNLLQELQDKLKLTYIFISHDLSVVKFISNRIAVMYLGKIVELTTSLDLFKNTLHPYSQALLSAVPIPRLNRKRGRIILSGGVPSPISPPSGCRFHTRCIHKLPVCSETEPELKNVGGSHMVACHLMDRR